ncbi:MAG: bifunctional DNA-formamidopyrimidine glycosylase/DNA-(apurinic or apyrimidinic site) lyase [Planctomycetota bacterium]
MPELPEVETTARLIRPGTVGRVVRDVDWSWARSLGTGGPERFREGVCGARIARVTRRAKYVVLELERRGKAAGAVLVHLRMTGRLVVQKASEEPPPFTRVSLELDRGVLHFLDVRKFGRVTFEPEGQAALAHLGPEPLGDEWTVERLRSDLAARNRAIKPLLLDQEFVAGLGNIYVDESLHAARIHPLLPAARVPRAKAIELHAAVRRILAEAIEREGSSFDGFYRTPEGQPGAYQHLFQVYGRTGRPCPRCGTAIRRIVVGQRGTHFCARCQPRPRA